MSAINRRQFVLAGRAAAAAQGAQRAQERRRYRNVLLLIADDLSPLAGCYGNPVIQTPNTDRLAGQGNTVSQRLLHDAVVQRQPLRDPHRPA
jgi:hypothetical protein